MRRVLAISVCLVGCGRIHFGSVDDGIIDGVGDSVNIAFVTSTTQVVPPGGLPAADDICATRATAAGFAGTYRAWLSTTAIDARDRLLGARGWVRPDGRPFADRIDDIVAGHIFYPPRIDETGGDVGDNALVMTGTAQNGTASTLGCTDFTSITGNVTSGSPHGGGTVWTNNNRTDVSCSEPSRLYCFGVDRSTPVTPPEVGTNRVAFVSSLMSLSSLPTIDAMCGTEASTAGLGGSFKSLLGISSATAASRFSAAGPAWVRRDGVALAPTAAEFLAGRLDAPIILDAAGGSRNAPVATGGAITTTPSLAETCSDWTSTSGAYSYGQSTSSGAPGYTYSASGICGLGLAVYCLQE